MCKHDRLGFDLQMMMLRKNVELVNPVSEGVPVGRASRSGIGDQTERQAALSLVVHRAQANFVIAFRDGAIVREFRRMQQMISVHATTA